MPARRTAPEVSSPGAVEAHRVIRQANAERLARPGSSYAQTQEPFVTPGLLGDAASYDAPAPVSSVYTAAKAGMLTATPPHAPTFSVAQYGDDAAVGALLEGIDAVEARVSALECKAALKGLRPIKALLWDMDGVLADVSQSYRAAIILAAKSFGVVVTGEDIGAAKAAGNANNDWVLTHRLVSEKMAAQGRPASHVPSLDAVTEAFEKVYQGGLWKTESLLVDPKLIAALAARYPMAIVTGRPRKPDAERFLEHYKLSQYFKAMVCMGETPKPKPDPAPCNVMLKALGVAGGSDVLMIGDTVDDIHSAIGAKCTGLGVPAPGHDIAADRKLLASAGATAVLTEGLPELAVLLDGADPAAKPQPGSTGYAWSVKISQGTGRGRPWSLRITPASGGGGGAGGGGRSDAERMAALLAGIAECEERLKALEKKKRAAGGGGGGNAAAAAAAAGPAAPAFFPPDMHWLRFGNCTGGAGFTTDATYTPPPEKPPQPAPEKAASADSSAKKKGAKKKKELTKEEKQELTKKGKQQKKKARVWTEEEKAAARAKAGAGKPEGKAQGEAQGKSPKPDGQPKQAAAKSSQPAKAETVAPAGGYSEAYSWVAVDLPVGSMEMPAVPVRASVAGSASIAAGAGGRPEATPAANEYVATDTQRKDAAPAAKQAAPKAAQKSDSAAADAAAARKARVEKLAPAPAPSPAAKGDAGEAARLAREIAQEQVAGWVEKQDAAAAGDAAFAASEKHLTPAPLGRAGVAVYDAPQPSAQTYSAAPKGMLSDTPANTLSASTAASGGGLAALVPGSKPKPSPLLSLLKGGASAAPDAGESSPEWVMVPPAERCDPVACDIETKLRR